METVRRIVLASPRPHLTAIAGTWALASDNQTLHPRNHPRPRSWKRRSQSTIVDRPAIACLQSSVGCRSPIFYRSHCVPWVAVAHDDSEENLSAILPAQTYCRFVVDDLLKRSEADSSILGCLRDGYHRLPSCRLSQADDGDAWLGFQASLLSVTLLSFKAASSSSRAHDPLRSFDRVG